MALIPLVLSDTFSQWKDKLNALINQVNNISPGTQVFAIQEPINTNDVLVWNPSAQKFTNINIVALLQQIQTDNGVDDTTEFFLTNQQDVF